MRRTNPLISEAVQSVAKSLCKPECCEVTSFRYLKRGDMPYLIVTGKKSMTDGSMTIKYEYVGESDHERLLEKYGERVRKSVSIRKRRG